jgi:hypothetical protein
MRLPTRPTVRRRQFYHRGREADLPLGVQDPTPGRDQHQHERPQQLGEQPAVLQLRIVELRARPELERQQTLSPREVVSREIWVFLSGLRDGSVSARRADGDK